jgi:RNA methyltransferase, TrmH family
MISPSGAGVENSKTAESGRMRRVEGRHNSLLKELRQAFHRAELTATGECAIEGFRIVEEAIRSGLKLRAIFVSESGQQRAARLLPQIGSHVETVLVPDKLFAAAVPSETPQGLAALVRIRAHSVEEILESSSPRPVLLIAGVQDPGNLGTILRSAEAFGVKGALLSEGTVSAYNSKVIRASAGSSFRVPLTKIDLKAAVSRLRDRGVRLLATSSHKGTALPEVSFRHQLAIVIGNEGAGIEKRLMSEMDELIMIPHSPKVESLNAGVAASIILYEAWRQLSAAQAEEQIQKAT